MPHLISISELIDHPWEQFRGSLSSYLSLSGWLLVPGLFFIIALLLYPTADKLLFAANLTGMQVAGISLYGLTTALILPLTSLWLYVAIARFAQAQLARGQGDVQKAMSDGRRLFWPTLGTSILFGLVLVASVIGPLLPGFILSVVTTGRMDAIWMIALRSILVVLGILASAVLTILWFGEYQFAPLVTVFEHAAVKKSLATSRALIKGRFWAVLIRSLLPKIVFLILGGIALWISLTLVNVGISLIVPAAPVAVLRVGTLFDTLLRSILLPIFLSPLLYLVDVHLYRSLKETL